jgi:hypothetical protein
VTTVGPSNGCAEARDSKQVDAPTQMSMVRATARLLRDAFAEEFSRSNFGKRRVCEAFFSGRARPNSLDLIFKD